MWTFKLSHAHRTRVATVRHHPLLASLAGFIVYLTGGVLGGGGRRAFDIFYTMSRSRDKQTVKLYYLRLGETFHKATGRVFIASADADGCDLYQEVTRILGTDGFELWKVSSAARYCD